MVVIGLLVFDASPPLSRSRQTIEHEFDRRREAAGHGEPASAVRIGPAIASRV
jgi:hypothetical protein